MPPDTDSLRSRRGLSRGAEFADSSPVVAEYPALKEVRSNLNLKWFRCPMKRGRLGDLMKRDDAQGLFQATGHLGIWCTTGALVYHCWTQQLWAYLPFAMFAHGTVGSTLVYGCHEMGHGTPFNTKWINSTFLFVYSLLFWWDPYEYAMSHTYHHRYTQHVQGDRENVFPLTPSLDPWLLLQLFTVNLGWPSRVFGKGGLHSCVWLTIKAACGGVAAPCGSEQEEWLLAVAADQPEEAIKSMWHSRGLLLFHVAVCATAVAYEEWSLIFIISFSSFFANWLSYFVGACQHMGLQGEIPDFRKNTRSIVLDPFTEFLFWRMNWHIEHHMFAAVPCYNLKKLHYECSADMPVPRTLIGAWREMRETWRRQQIDPSYAYDTPIPAPKHADSNQLVVEEIGKDMGDLAPEALK